MQSKDIRQLRSVVLQNLRDAAYVRQTPSLTLTLPVAHTPPPTTTYLSTSLRLKLSIIKPRQNDTVRSELEDLRADALHNNRQSPPRRVCVTLYRSVSLIVPHTLRALSGAWGNGRNRGGGHVDKTVRLVRSCGYRYRGCKTGL